MDFTGQFDDLGNSLFADQVGNFRISGVDGHQAAADGFADESHAEFFGLSPLGKNFGMSGLSDSSGLHGSFVGRTGCHGIDSLGQASVDGFSHVSIGGLARCRVDGAGLELLQIHQAEIEYGRRANRIEVLLIDHLEVRRFSRSFGA